jgi:hypothetical protein
MSFFEPPLEDIDTSRFNISYMHPWFSWTKAERAFQRWLERKNQHEQPLSDRYPIRKPKVRK